MKENYYENIMLKCPVCGGDQFIFNDQDDEDPAKCVECGLICSKQDLIECNSQEIDNKQQEMFDEVKRDFEKSLKDIFKKWK